MCCVFFSRNAYILKYFVFFFRSLTIPLGTLSIGLTSTILLSYKKKIKIKLLQKLKKQQKNKKKSKNTKKKFFNWTCYLKNPKKMNEGEPLLDFFFYHCKKIYWRLYFLVEDWNLSSCYFRCSIVWRYQFVTGTCHNHEQVLFMCLNAFTLHCGSVKCNFMRVCIISWGNITALLRCTNLLQRTIKILFVSIWNSSWFWLSSVRKLACMSTLFFWEAILIFRRDRNACLWSAFYWASNALNIILI